LTLDEIVEGSEEVIVSDDELLPQRAKESARTAMQVRLKIILLFFIK
jgi:hypothetical protein